MPPPKLSVRVGWPPDLVFKLLQVISEDPLALQTYFPTSTTQALGKLKQSKKFCAVFFKNDNYMREIARLGYARRDHNRDEWNIEEWLKIDSKNTVYDKIVVLKRNYLSGKFRDDNGMKDEWRSFEDIPDRKKRHGLRAKIPYYFLLKNLCSRDDNIYTSEALIITDTISSTQSKRGKRKDRSPSIISISSDSEIPLRQIDDVPTSPVQAPKSKRVRRAVPTSSPDIDKDIQEDPEMGSDQDEDVDKDSDTVSDGDSRRTATPLRDITLLDNVNQQLVPMGEGISDSEDDTMDDQSCSSSSSSSSSSDSEEVAPLSPRAFTKTTKPRRSIINNTIPKPGSAIPDGPETAEEDAIEVAENRSTGDHDSEQTDERKDNIGVAPNGGPIKIPPDASFEAVMTVIICHGALDRSKLRGIQLKNLESEMGSGQMVFSWMEPSLISWMGRRKETTKQQRKSIVACARMEVGLEAVDRILIGIQSPCLPLDGYGLDLSFAPTYDYLFKYLSQLIRKAGGMALAIPEEIYDVNVVKRYFLTWQNHGLDKRQREIYSSQGLTVCHIDAWIFRFFNMCKNFENENYQVEERVEELMVQSRRQKKCVGDGTLVFVNASLGKLFKRNLRKLARSNGFTVAYSARTWEASTKTKPEGQPQDHMGLTVDLLSKPDFKATNGMTIRSITPAGLCDYVDDLRSRAPENQPPAAPRKKNRRKRRGKKQGGTPTLRQRRRGRKKNTYSGGGKRRTEVKKE
ncbi:hypothetical protein I302_101302 [Kwoniella bestiolae CBS 10118]|uniref:Uncharacterized protein n=1 Tax=Kwoniella bestiolae CBS 10118 TaxID=1296100 RepID=A0A1B9G7G8_9TREE|nr:hypothetical protein I302_04676 [Kwoniella bestiolae CBS 10118]OCF26984.1 hypothetical protein I302_04676 [Kwoniella bestiolae CBS 10118]